jgi:DNA (cytosine-5)-methyltransferase 1
MNFISLFSGIGGIDYGLELAGMTSVAQIEINEVCQCWLTHHWPRVPKWKDIRGFSIEKWKIYCEVLCEQLRKEGKKEVAPQIDLIAGGFP